MTGTSAAPRAARGGAARRMAADAAEGRFRLPVCPDCGGVQYPPREVCAACLCTALEWRDVDPGGTVLAATALHRSREAYFRERLPWTIGSVALDAGPVVLANFPARHNLAAGDRVILENREAEGGYAALFACPPGKS